MGQEYAIQSYGKIIDEVILFTACEKNNGSPKQNIEDGSSKGYKEA